MSNASVDSWKNSSKKVFLDQFERNKKELTGQLARPPHWKIFIDWINKYHPKRVVDIGCGAGVYSLLHKFTSHKYEYNPYANVEYIGYDYAEAAIEVAKEAWNDTKSTTKYPQKDCFYVKDYKDLKKEDMLEGDGIVCNGLCGILENGDECLRHILGLGVKNVLIQRQFVHDKPKEIESYDAYGMMTFGFKYNRKELLKDAKDNNYDIELVRLHGILDDHHDLIFTLKN